MHYSNTATYRQLFRKKALGDLIAIPASFYLVFLISSYLNLSEAFNRWAIHHEKTLNIDEFPLALLAAMAAMAWFSARRWFEARNLLRQNHELLRHALHAQENERRQIALDLHDHLGQYLNAIKIDASGMIQSDSLPNDAKKIALRIVNHSDYAYKAAKQLICRLRPVALDDLGLSAAMQHLIDAWKKPGPDSSRSAEYSLEMSGGIDSFNEQDSLSIYRIVQEGLTNAARHSGASQIKINIHHDENTLSLLISDNGNGIRSGNHMGLGLTGMRERVESLGGIFRIDSSPGHGTHILAEIPMVNMGRVLH